MIQWAWIGIGVWEAVEYLGDTKLNRSRAIGTFEATAAFIYQGWCHRLGNWDKSTPRRTIKSRKLKPVLFRLL